MSHLNNYSGLPPHLPGSSIPPTSFYEEESYIDHERELSSEDMISQAASNKDASSQVSRNKLTVVTQPPPQGWIQKIIAKIKSFRIKPAVVAPISPERQIAGKRVYHQKSDLKPWFDNMITSGENSVQKIYNVLEKQLDRISSSDLFLQGLILQKAVLAKAEAFKKLDELEQKIENALFSKEAEEANALIARGKYMKKLKKYSLQVEKEIHKIIKDFSHEIQTQVKQIPLPPKIEKSIDTFCLDVMKNASNIEGVERFKLIHKDPLWDPNTPTTRRMAFTSSSTGETIVGTNTMQSLGPAFTSQAPRNRNASQAVVPNFFRTTFELTSPNKPEKKKNTLEFTRSAIAVEFDQPDPIERTKANRNLLKQTIDAGVTHWLEKLSTHSDEDKRHLLSEKGSIDNPIVFKRTTVNFLTPDVVRLWSTRHPIFRKIVSKIDHALSGARADDERSLAFQSMAAHKDLNGQVVAYKYFDVDKNEEKTVYVKYDLRYFNVPSNKQHERLPEVFTDSPELTHANNMSWMKMERDVNDKMERMDKKLATKLDALNLPEGTTKRFVQDINKSMADCIKTRSVLMHNAIQKGDFSDKAFKEWQKKAENFVDFVKTLQNNLDQGDPVNEYLDMVLEKMKLSDLYMDTKELYESGLGKDLSKMDNNRFALSSRLVLLADKISDKYIGCRSGKDRTILADSEMKLLHTEIELKGRVPSYREQEQMEDVMDHREIILEQSGNVFDAVRANLGASIGLMSFGAAPKAPKNKKAKQFIEVTKASQGYAKMAHRPLTKWVVPPGQMDKWEIKDGIFKPKKPVIGA